MAGHTNAALRAAMKAKTWNIAAVIGFFTTVIMFIFFLCHILIENSRKWPQLTYSGVLVDFVYT